MNELTRCIFSGMKILSDQEWLLDHAVVVEEDKIKAIIHKDMISNHLPASHHEYDQECYLIPGLIDLHVHGANGHDVMDGTPEAQLALSRALACEGVTGYLATTMTASVEKIESVLKSVATAQPIVDGAAILGVHLEGPFIAKEKLGAQGADTQLPDIEKFRHWQYLAENSIRLVTLAPELPGSAEFIAAISKMGVIAAIGHTAATYEQTQAAIAAGSTYATHLFNAMSGLQQRAPGAVGAVLLANKVTAEIIVDGIHLHPAIVELVLHCKGKDKIVLITDAMRAKCLSDGKYELGGNEVFVQQGKATLGDGTLAGSTLRLTEAIKNMVQFSKCSLAEAIAMATYNPAHVLGLTEAKGSIAAGKDADLVVIDSQFNVKMAMRAGLVLNAQHESHLC